MLQTPLDAVFAGRVQLMPGDSRSTAIFKQRVEGEVEIGRDGLLCDEQADRRVHGGPEKAVHQFPAEHYVRFATLFPDSAACFVAGSMGENLSARGWREEDVCIGDVFAIGTVRLQLSQPRSPCWKIDARYGLDGLTLQVETQGIAGWYYRVLAPGRLRAGESMTLIERNHDPVSLREYWMLKHEHRPSLDALQRVIDTPGLTLQQQARWQQRLDWLRKAAT